MLSKGVVEGSAWRPIPNGSAAKTGAWAGKQTSSFGLRTDPVTGKKGSTHEGIDIASKKGTAVTANVSGKVIASGSAKANGYASSYGNIVIIEDSKGNHHYYAHLDKAVAKKGSMIKAGDLAGNVGSTGKSTGPHLHYEVRNNGKVLNPTAFLPTGKNSNVGSKGTEKSFASKLGAAVGKTTSFLGLGSLSAKYESSGNPATVAADRGGNSYGTYQLSTLSGNAQKFANSYGGSLKGKKPNTAAFDKAWKAEAAKNPEKFADAQHNYIKKNHYDPAANKFSSATGINVSKSSKAVKDMIWSVGVQHGSGGANSIFTRAKVNSKMSDKQIIARVYAERMRTDVYFKSSSKSQQATLKKRFQNEMNDALKMLV